MATTVPADAREIARLLDENEQLRTALEWSTEEVDRLLEHNERLQGRVTSMAQALNAANGAYHLLTARLAQAGGTDGPPPPDGEDGAEAEELRAAFEELQVLTEELEIANDHLRQANSELDARVEERTVEIGQVNSALSQSENRLNTLVSGIPQLVWRARDEGEWTWSSPQWTDFTGLSMADSLGRGWLRAVHADDREATQAAWAAAAGAGELDVDHRLWRPAEGRHRWFQTRAAPVRGENGAIVEWLGTCTDVDSLRRLQERQEVMVAELQHRTRNLIAVVRSLAEQTMRDSPSLREFTPRFRDRLAMLGRVQGLLSRLGEGERITFDQLLRAILAAHADLLDDKRRVHLDGPPGAPALSSGAVQTLAMALHELATNALKHGALSQPEGRLDVRWRVDQGAEDGRAWLHVAWRESGVVMASPAPQRGGGRDLIERALPYQLGARTSFGLEPDGVYCTIEIPLPTAEPEATGGQGGAAAAAKA
jgi:PAS domain S-box-containing protein